MIQLLTFSNMQKIKQHYSILIVSLFITTAVVAQPRQHINIDNDWKFAFGNAANPEKDFNYVVINYHNTNYPDSLINLEKKYWQPFIQKAMDKGQTPQQAWGNAVVLAPQGDNIKFTTVSYDLFKTLQDALMPNWDTKTVFPAKGLSMIDKMLLTRRGITVYRIVKVVTAPM